MFASKNFPKVRLLIVLIVISLLVCRSQSQVCAQSQYFNGQRCAPCKQNCKCTSDNTCDTCLPGYTFDSRFQNCLQCPLAIDSINVGCKQCCSQIKGTAFVCSQCLSSDFIFLRGGQCINANGCTNLLNTGICTSCQSGFYLTKGTCQSCHPSCQSCKDNSYCLSCNPGYFNSTNINYSLCGACPIGCQTCTSVSSCQTCVSGYYLTGSMCMACGVNCVQCTASGCSACATGSALIGKVCFLCTDGTKGGSAGCTECQTVSNIISCTSAALTFYINNNGQSIPCSTAFPNSLYCTSTGPLQCLHDYDPILTNRNHLINNQCISNINSCKSIKNTAGDCSQCYFEGPNSYYKLAGNTCIQCNQSGCQSYTNQCQCLSCQSGYRFVNNLCVACQNLHCIKCQNDVQSCQQCETYYGLYSLTCVYCSKSNCLNCDGDYTQCKVCQDGYYLSAGTCYLCQTGCLLCQSNTKCTQCANGYYLQTNGRCKQNPSNCLEIDPRYVVDNVAVCKKCSYGYQVIDGNCYPCSQSLYNLNTCQKYCPSYYALHKFAQNIGLKHILSILVLVATLIFL